jgi:hypothetical protein
MNCIFPFSWECHNPNELIFFRGVAQPPISVLMVIINGDNGYGVSNGDLMFNDELVCLNGVI